MSTPAPLHFFYSKSPFGRWAPNTSPTRPDQITRDGTPIKYVGHRQLSEAEAQLTLSELAERFLPVPTVATPDPDNATAGQLRQALSYLVDVMTRANQHGVTDREWDAAIEKGQVALAATA